MNKDKVGNRFRTELQKIGGQKFFGTIYRPSISNERGQNLHKSSRILKVSKNSPVTFGDVITGKSGASYICADNGSAEVAGYSYRTMKLFLVEDQWLWERQTTVEDVVTGLQSGTGFAELGQVYVSIEPDGEIIDFNVQQPRKQVVLSAEVQLGDRLAGKYTVTKLDKRIGIWVAEVV